MASHTGDGGDGFALVVLIEAEIFFVDLGRHLEHMTCDVFFRLGIAGKVQVMRGTVGGGRVTETAFHAKGGFPAVHDLAQVFVADVFGKDLQVFMVGFPVRGTGGGHTYYHQDNERGCNHQFFTVQHKEVIFWIL